MGKLAALLLAVVLVSALGIGYVMYKQLGTDTTLLQGTPALAADGRGAECGEVDFEVKARSLGQWHFNVGKARTITGEVVVGGNEDQDVGFSIWSPSNRVVVFDAERLHQTTFEIEHTIRGDYRFEFDNRHSTFSEKQVTVSLCVT